MHQGYQRYAQSIRRSHSRRTHNRLHQNTLAVDVHLIVQTGKPIVDVAHAAQSAVRAALSFALDLPDPIVNIRVQGVGGRP